jgi:hypothetical protein
MNYTFLSTLTLGLAIATAPACAQFSSFSSSSDACSGVCVKLDFGSANNDNSFSNGFGSSSPASNNNIRWQLGVTWRPNPPEIGQVEAERTKQKLDDNRTLMTSLADAIAQNKTELARGLAILLAPRLGYSNPIVLIAEMKQGSMNIGATPTSIPKAEITPTPKAETTSTPPTIQSKEAATTDDRPTIELR